MNKNNRITYFNLLKFISAIIIAIFLHYGDHFTRLLNITNPFPNNHFLYFLSKKSFVLVEMFFMISGILFKIAYCHKIIENMSFRTFIKNRIVRIYPLLIITTFYMYIINILLYKFNNVFWEGGTLSLISLLTDIVFAGKPIFNAINTLNGTIWYINVLMLCYVIAYYLTLLYKKYRTSFIYFVPIFIGLLIRYSDVSFLFWNLNVARGLMSFFLGVLLSFAFDKVDKLNNKVRIKYKLLLLLELLLFFFLQTRKNSFMFIDDVLLSYTFLVFPELLLILYDNLFINKLCDNKFVEFLGNISFGIYLWNFPILSTLFLLIINKIIKINVLSINFFILNILIHLIVSTISYFIIDKHFILFLKNKVNGNKVKKLD